MDLDIAAQLHGMAALPPCTSTALVTACTSILRRHIGESIPCNVAVLANSVQLVAIRCLGVLGEVLKRSRDGLVPRAMAFIAMSVVYCKIHYNFANFGFVFLMPAVRASSVSFVCT